MGAMYSLIVTCIVIVLSSKSVYGKMISGVFKSDLARQQNGQFITNFMYQGDKSLFVCRVPNVPLAVEKESHLLLFQGSYAELDNLSCSERLAKASLTISLSQEEYNLTIPQRTSPTVWRAVYVDRYTCQDGGVVPSQGDLEFTVLLFNADSAGNPLEHFSAEEAGLHSFYFMLLLAYFVASCIYVKPLYQVLKKGGPMHAVLKVLSAAMALQGVSTLCNYVHLARYSRDGVGIPLMGSLAELCDTVSRVSMLYMLLSLAMGWSLSRGRKPQSRPLQWDTSPTSTALATGAVVAQGALLLWELWCSSQEPELHSSQGGHTVPWALLMVLRVGLAVLLASLLCQVVSTERSALKRDFYVGFAKGCFLWLLCHPVLTLISVVLNAHQRDKVVSIGVILCQSIAMVTLYQLFLSRSLYWEVSSLSSMSLPLTMSRGSHRGRY